MHFWDVSFVDRDHEVPVFTMLRKKFKNSTKPNKYIAVSFMPDKHVTYLQEVEVFDICRGRKMCTISCGAVYQVHIMSNKYVVIHVDAKELRVYTIHGDLCAFTEVEKIVSIDSSDDNIYFATETDVHHWNIRTNNTWTYPNPVKSTRIPIRALDKTRLLVSYHPAESKSYSELHVVSTLTGKLLTIVPVNINTIRDIVLIDGGFALISDTNILTITRAFEKLLNFQHKFNPLTKHDEFTHRMAFVDRHELYLFSAPYSASKIWNTETGELLAKYA
jgi:hypothetical protein